MRNTPAIEIPTQPTMLTVTPDWRAAFGSVLLGNFWHIVVACTDKYIKGSYFTEFNIQGLSCNRKHCDNQMFGAWLCWVDVFFGQGLFDGLDHRDNLIISYR